MARDIKFWKGIAVDALSANLDLLDILLGVCNPPPKQRDAILAMKARTFYSLKMARQEAEQ